MWQVYAAFRLGDYRTAEIDLTPVLGAASLVAAFLLILKHS